MTCGSVPIIYADNDKLTPTDGRRERSSLRHNASRDVRGHNERGHQSAAATAAAVWAVVPAARHGGWRFGDPGDFRSSPRNTDQTWGEMVAYVKKLGRP